MSYFRLIKAFGLGLKNEDSTFKSGVTFEQIKGLYIFNAKFRHLLFSQIEKVEVNLRCRIANYFSCKSVCWDIKMSEIFKTPNSMQSSCKKLLTRLKETVNRFR